MRSNHTCFRLITMPLYCLAPAETLAVSYIEASFYHTSVCVCVGFLSIFLGVPWRFLGFFGGFLGLALGFSKALRGFPYGGIQSFW